MKSPLLGPTVAICLALMAGPLVAAPRPQPADGLDRRLFEPDPTAPLRAPTPMPKTSAPAAAAAAQQPLLGVAQNMQVAGQRLRQADAGRETQQLQRQIVADLERLLREARSQGQATPRGEDEPALPTARRPVAQPPAAPSGEGKPSDQPAVAGGTRSGPQSPGPPDRRAQLQAVHDALKQLWGELPDRAREQMLQQVPVEEFLPQYEALIEAYFRRLAEEQGRGP